MRHIHTAPAPRASRLLPAKGPNIDRVRGAPDGNNPDGGQQRGWQTQQQQQQQQQQQRESPQGSRPSCGVTQCRPVHPGAGAIAYSGEAIVAPAHPRQSYQVSRIRPATLPSLPIARRRQRRHYVGGPPNENRLNISMASLTSAVAKYTHSHPRSISSCSRRRRSNR